MQRTATLPARRAPRARLGATATLLLALVFAGNAWAVRVTDADYPRSLEQTGPVAVSWTDPAQFTEVRHSRNRFEAVQGDWVRDLAEHLAQRAADALRPGEQLAVEITDIKRAGEFEPAIGRSDHVRIVRDIYPPRIELNYTLSDAAGNVIASGERRLSDLAFLSRTPGSTSMGNSLRHEERLLNDWIRRDIADRTN